MSKSIYNEAIFLLLSMGTEFISVPCNPIGEENSDMIHLRDATETYETNMYEVVEALRQAQKQEKLLELYRELMTVKDELMSLAYFGDTYFKPREIEAKLEKQIKELENGSKIQTKQHL